MPEADQSGPIDLASYTISNEFPYSEWTDLACVILAVNGAMVPNTDGTPYAGPALVSICINDI